MSDALEATFEGGVFRPLQTETLAFTEGQRVKLTVEVVEQTASAATNSTINVGSQTDVLQKTELGKTDDAVDSFSLLKKRPLTEADLSLLSPDLARYARVSGLGPNYQSWAASVEPPKQEKRWWENVAESLSVPPILLTLIGEKFGDIVAEVRNIDRPESTNKIQKYTRSSLAYFTNLSSLFIYLALLAAVFKIIILFGARQTRIVHALEYNYFGLALVVTVATLLALLGVQALQKIAHVFRSYRVMAVIGSVIAIRFMIRTTFVLFTAASVTNMGSAAWQLLSGAFR